MDYHIHWKYVEGKTRKFVETFSRNFHLSKVIKFVVYKLYIRRECNGWIPLQGTNYKYIEIDNNKKVHSGTYCEICESITIHDTKICLHNIKSKKKWCVICEVKS